jgi:integrase
MPKRVPEMAAIQVKRITEPGKYNVGGVAGLVLRVSDTGAKSWILRATIGGRRREIGLGGYPDVSLSQARDKAREMRETILQGRDPISERRERAKDLRDSKTISFGYAAERAYEKKIQEFRSDKHAQNWFTSIEIHALPRIGKVPVDQITITDILAVLEPIWTKKTETASRLRQRLEYILNWATVSGYREGDNPARWKGHLDAVLPKPSKVRKVRHHPALPWRELPEFMARLRARNGLAARALEFIILTAARSGEVRLATRDEFDLKDRLWIVPAERMKAGREHRVPLSGDAVALVENAPEFPGCPYVFPAPRGGPLSDMSISAVCKRMKVDAVPHGFRSTFRDWCAESTNYPREVAEMALAHTISNAVEAAYRRGDLLDKRRRLMDSWAAFCRGGTVWERVTPIWKAL